MEFQEFKTEILRRAHEAGACVTEYQRAYKSETLEELVQVVKDNFSYCANNKVIDGELLEAVGNDVLNPLGVFVNCDATGDGYLLLTGSSRAVCRDNSRAVCRENSRAVCRDNSSAVCRDNSSAVCRENSRAVCRDNSYCVAKNETIEVKLSDNALARFEQTNRIVVTNNPKIEIYETKSN